MQQSRFALILRPYAVTLTSRSSWFERNTTYKELPRYLRTVDGPFAESKELVGGYWLIQVKSLEEAIEWAKRSPFSPNGPDQETEIEVREFSEFE